MIVPCNELPDRLFDNLSNFCGWRDMEISDEELELQVRQEIAKFNGTLDLENNTLIFQSETHYHWFLLKWG
jgi:hypothetical protein